DDVVPVRAHEGVIPVPTDEAIVTQKAVDRVVARAAIDRVVATAAGDHVIAGPPGHAGVDRPDRQQADPVVSVGPVHDDPGDGPGRHGLDEGPGGRVVNEDADRRERQTVVEDREQAGNPADGNPVVSGAAGDGQHAAGQRRGDGRGWLAGDDVGVEEDVHPAAAIQRVDAGPAVEGI